MNTLSIPFLGRVYKTSFPSCYEELSAEQLRRLVPIIPHLRAAYARLVKAPKWDASEKYDSDEVLQHYRLRALLVLLNLKPWHWYKRLALWSVFADEMAVILTSTNFLLTQEQYEAELPLRVKIGRRRCAGPGVNLKLLTGEEFHFADRAYWRLKELEAQNDYTVEAGLAQTQALNELCWCLYRPAQPYRAAVSDDLRQLYHRKVLEREARQMSKVPLWQRRLILWWYRAQVVNLQKRYPKIFTKKEGQADRRGWLPIFRTLAKEPLKVEEIGRLRMGMILYELGEQIDEAQRIRAKMKAR